MRLKSFQVRKYKNVRSSGEVTVEDGVTCLVGKNESGKSALLQALYRLNPMPTGHPDTFVGLRDYPRRHYGQDKDRVPATRPVTATFELDDEDVQAVEAVHGRGVLASRLVTVSKTYENELAWELDCDERGHVEQAMEDAGPGDERQREATDARSRQGRIGAIVHGFDTRDELLAKLPSANAPPADPVRPGAGEGCRSGIQRIIEGRLPKFLYFDEYSVMSGRVSVPRLQSAGKGGLNPGECTTLSLMRLAKVDLTEFTRDEYEARRASLEAAANQISNDVFTYWSQNRSLAVEFDVDFDGARAGGAGPGPFIELRIRNHRHGITLNFSERSQGFTWFFSLLATLSELRHSKRMILLLDEPGLSLHASAQHDLLRFIDERLTPAHQVLYSTHSPFMVAATDLERVRTVEDRDGEGTRVSHEFLDHSDETRLPLQAALGQELIRSLPAAPATLLVEGPSDHVFLTAMSSRLEALGRTYLDPRWTIVPAGGLAGVSAFVALLGPRSNLAVLVDVFGGKNQGSHSTIARRMIADKGIVRLVDFAEMRHQPEGTDEGKSVSHANPGSGGRSRRRRTGKAGAEIGAGEAGKAGTGAGANTDADADEISVDDRPDLDDAGVVDGLDFDDDPVLDEADIEDLFAEDFYVDLVNRSGAAAIEPFEIHGAGRIVHRIEMATGLGLDRYLPARLLLDRQADPASGGSRRSRMDGDTLDRFEALFSKINGLIA